MSLTSTHTTEEWVMRDMRILERPSAMLKVKASVQQLIVSIYQKRLAVWCLVMNHLQSKESFTVKGVITQPVIPRSLEFEWERFVDYWQYDVNDKRSGTIQNIQPHSTPFFDGTHHIISIILKAICDRYALCHRKWKKLDPFGLPARLRAFPGVRWIFLQRNCYYSFYAPNNDYLYVTAVEIAPVLDVPLHLPR